MEYLEKRWRCDFCGRDVKRGVMPPSGWHEANSNTTHCCADIHCHAKMVMFCEKNGIPKPETLHGEYVKAERVQVAKDQQ